MKRTLAIACILASFMPLLSQHNRAYHEHHDRVVGLEEIDGVFYLGAEVRNPSDPNLFRLRKLNGYGSLASDQVISRGGITEVSQLMATSDKNLLLVGTDHGCDYGFANKFLLKIDTAGNVIFDKGFTSAEFFKLLVAEVNNVYHVVTPDKILRYDNNGNALTSILTNIINITAITSYTGGTMLVSGTHQSGTRLLLIDGTGNVLDFVSTLPAKKILLYGEDQVILLGVNGSVQKFTPRLEAIGNPKFSPAFVDLEVRRDTLYAVTPTHTYMVMDSSYNTILSFSGPYNSGGKHLAISDSRAALGSDYGGFSATQLTGGHCAQTIFPKLQSYAYTHDLGVTTWTADSCYALTYTPYGSPDTRVDGYFAFDVTVKNFGPDTIRSFYLNVDLTPIVPAFCSVTYYHNLESQALAPGASIVLSTGRLIVPWVRQIVGSNTLTAMQFDNVSIYTSVPNEEVDGNPGNDAHVAAITTPLTVSLSEYAANLPQVRVYPNPASEKIFVASNETISRISLLDFTGKELAVVTPANTNFEFDLSQYPAGIYFLRLFSNDRSVTEKIIKQ